MAAISSSTFPAVSSLSSLSTASTVKARQSTCSIPCPNFFAPNGTYNVNLKAFRPSISHGISTSNRLIGVPMVSCLDSNQLGADIESESSKEAKIDLKLPRRSLLVHFTCNACGERTQKLVNRLAYERGTVFVQCAGCFQHHRLIDNLGLVSEYDFREDTKIEKNAD